MESRMSFWRRNVVRKGVTVLGLTIAAVLAIGASQASAQGFRIGGGQVEIYGGQGGYGGGYRGAPRRGRQVDVYRRQGHYDYHPGGVHYDRPSHPGYSHWTPFQRYPAHGHYDDHRNGSSGGRHH